MQYSREVNSLNEGVEFVKGILSKLKIPKDKAKTAAVNAEHAIWHIMKQLDNEGDPFKVTVHKTLFFTDIIISGEGTRMHFDDEECAPEDRNSPDILYKRRFHEAFNYKRVNRTNSITFNVSESETNELMEALGSMALGIIFGLIVRNFCTEKIVGVIDYYILSLFSNIFMNALKIVVGPVVFFSLVCCVSRFKNLKDLGRIAIKTMGLYFFTTIIAIMIGLGLYSAFPVGNNQVVEYVESHEQDEEEAEEYSETVENYEAADFSIRNLIASTVPDNFFNPFVEVNLLQIIFLAILIGVGIGRCGDYSELLMNFAESINHLLTILTTIITKFIPVAIFCAMATLVIDVGLEALYSIFTFAVLVVCGMLLMMLFYGIFMLFTTGLNPIVFYKKFAKTMMTAFATSSATATMPTSMNCCKEMGVDESISSFSIPLGANVNMDGSSMVFMIVVLFMCHIYGINMTGTMLLSTIVSIVFLALGSPTVAGADLVIIAVLLNQVGVPIEAIGLILGVDAIFDMVQCMSNCTGDAVVSIIIAKSEKRLDIKKYNS